MIVAKLGSIAKRLTHTQLYVFKYYKHDTKVRNTRKSNN